MRNMINGRSSTLLTVSVTVILALPFSSQSSAAPERWLAGPPPRLDEMPRLIRQLADPFVCIAKNAEDGLVRIGTPAVEPLRHALKDRDPVVRAEAVRVLGRIADPKAIPDLIRLLSDLDFSVRAEAARALGKVGDARASTALIDALAENRAGAGLDQTMCVASEARAALAKLGTPAIRPLIEALHSKSAGTRELAAATLGDIKDPRATAPLLPLLRDEAVEVRWRTAEALGKIGDPTAEDPLITALSDPSGSVKHWAAASLGKLKARKAVPYLMRCLSDSNSGVRRDAAEALGMIGYPGVVDRVIPLLTDPDSLVRRAAALALGRIKDPRAIPPLLAASGGVGQPYVDCVDGLSEFGPAAADPLLAALKSDVPPTRMVAIRALGKLKDSRAVDPIIEAAGSSQSNAAFVTAAIQALTEIGDPRVVPLLAEYLKSRSTGPRRFPLPKQDLLILTEFGEPGAAALADIIAQNSDLSEDACAAVRQMGPVAVQPVVSVLKSGGPGPRFLAARTLGEIGDASAAPALFEAISDSDQWVRQTAVDALGKLKSESAMAKLIDLATTGNPNIKERAALAAAQIGKPAVAPLRKLTTEGDLATRSIAVRALGHTGDLSQTDTLVAALADRDSRIRLAAAEALWALKDPKSARPVAEFIRTGSYRDGTAKDRAVRLLSGIQPEGVDSLIAFLKERDGVIRELACKGLAFAKDPRATEPLIALLKDGYTPARKAAANALGEAGDSRAAAPLIAALKDKDTDVRAAAAAALGNVRDPEGRDVQPLLELLNSNDDVRVREAAVRSLGRLNDSRAIDPLIAALKDSDGKISGAARRALNSLSGWTLPRLKNRLPEWRRSATRKVTTR